MTAPIALKNFLLAMSERTHGRFVYASHALPGHENRMAAHEHRVWNHKCERTPETRCEKCIYGKKRARPKLKRIGR